MNNINFKDNSVKEHVGDYLAIMNPNVHNKTELFNDIQTKLQFPEYFGNNWDATLDCLSDLSWISNKNIVIVYEHVPNLPHGILLEYIQTLNDAIERLKALKSYTLTVYFPNKMLNQMPK